MIRPQLLRPLWTTLCPWRPSRSVPVCSWELLFSARHSLAQHANMLHACCTRLYATAQEVSTRKRDFSGLRERSFDSLRSLRTCVARSLRGFLLLGESLDRFVERVVFRWRRGAELHIGLFDFDVWSQPAFVDARTRRREIAHRREQQAAAIGELHELLTRGAAERSLADQFGALVPAERRREHLRGSCGALVDQQ